MKDLYKLRLEATHLLTVYNEHKDSPDALMRRRAYVQLDRFLMENRELVTTLLVEHLQERAKPSLIDKILRRTP